MQITEGTRKVVAAVIYGLAIVVGLGLLAGAYRKTHPTEEKINVTGMASKDIVSDLIAWDGNMQRKNMSLQEAYAQLAADTKLVKEYLSEHGIADNEVVFSAVDISKENEYRNDGNGHYYYVFSGYQLSQRVHVESKDIEKVEEIARNVTSLINKGVELYSDAPEYYYTKLSELKIEMIAKATEDATTRATQIAEKSHSKLGNLRSAQMGTFQITAPNSSEDSYTWDGAFNTRSKTKRVSITMRLSFGVK